MKLDVDCKELHAFVKKLERLNDKRIHDFISDTSKALAARLIAMAKGRTNVITGQLRRGWTGEKEQSATAYANSLPVERSGDKFIITITNPVEYASYVEYGHRTVSGGWVEGRYMLTRSEMELEEDLPRLLEHRIEIFFRRYFK